MERIGMEPRELRRMLAEADEVIVMLATAFVYTQELLDVPGLPPYRVLTLEIELLRIEQAARRVMRIRRFVEVLLKD